LPGFITKRAGTSHCPYKGEIKRLGTNGYQLIAKNCYLCYFLVKIFSLVMLKNEASHLNGRRSFPAVRMTKTKKLTAINVIGKSVTFVTF
jgi:hypothetical protein